MNDTHLHLAFARAQRIGRHAWTKHHAAARDNNLDELPRAQAALAHASLVRAHAYLALHISHYGAKHPRGPEFLAALDHIVTELHHEPYTPAHFVTFEAWLDAWTGTLQDAATHLTDEEERLRTAGEQAAIAGEWCTGFEKLVRHIGWAYERPATTHPRPQFQRLDTPGGFAFRAQSGSTARRGVVAGEAFSQPSGPVSGSSSITAGIGSAQDGAVLPVDLHVQSAVAGDEMSHAHSEEA